MKVLVAGGAGFIGSTVASACLDHGIVPVVLDNLCSGRIEFTRGRIFYPGDIADGPLIDRIFAEHPDISAVVHAAALVVVPESVTQPLHYYRENVAKSIDFIEHVLRNGCHRYLFSSSAAIYRPGDDFTVDEASPIAPASPYARTKAAMEDILADAAGATALRALSLRYFNPIGADPWLRTGSQVAEPTHALGRMIGARAAGTEFVITGVDWPTRDGSGIRDYIHVWDLARAHVRALCRFDRILPTDGSNRTEAVNLGTGNGTTVREFVAAFQGVAGPLRVRDAPARPGDGPGSYNRSVRSFTLLDWRPEFSVRDGIRHALRWAAVRDRILAATPAGVAPADRIPAGIVPAAGTSAGVAPADGTPTGMAPAGPPSAVVPDSVPVPVGPGEQPAAGPIGTGAA